MQDPTLLLQRQAEVAGVLRNPILNADDLLAAFDTVTCLSAFVTRLGRVATQLQLPLELTFQALMQMGFGEVNFDRQARQGNVPMHQAKVITRGSATEIEPKLRGAVDPAELEHFITQAQTLRHFLRMKVEDANDLSLARRALALAEDYLRTLHGTARGSGPAMWALFSARDEAALTSLLRGAGVEVVGGGEEEQRPPPADIARGVRALCADHLSSTSAAVALRLRTLRTLQRWVDAVDSERVVELFPLLKHPLAVQLAEKRSAVCRAACELVSLLSARSLHRCDVDQSVRDAVAAWADVLLRQVHVTVAAIATATDAVMRDLILGTGGGHCVVAPVVSVLAKATQPELQRKCLSYVCLGLVCAGSVASNRLGFAMVTVSKFFVGGQEPCRRLARVCGIVYQDLFPTSDLPGWDDRTEKAATAERGLVLDVFRRGDVGVFEVEVLRCPTPSTVGALGPAMAPSAPITRPIEAAAPTPSAAVLPKPWKDPKRLRGVPQSPVIQTAPPRPPAASGPPRSLSGSVRDIEPDATRDAADLTASLKRRPRRSCTPSLPPLGE